MVKLRCDYNIFPPTPKGEPIGSSQKNLFFMLILTLISVKIPFVHFIPNGSPLGVGGETTIEALSFKRKTCLH